MYDLIGRVLIERLKAEDTNESIFNRIQLSATNLLIYREYIAIKSDCSRDHKDDHERIQTQNVSIEQGELKMICQLIFFLEIVCV